MQVTLPNNIGAPLPKDSPAAQFVGEGDVLLTRAEVAQFLRTSVPTLERWDREGYGPPCRRVGRRALYPLVGVRRFAGLDSAAA